DFAWQKATDFEVRGIFKKRCRKIQLDNREAALVSRWSGRTQRCKLFAWIVVRVEAVGLGILQPRNERVGTAAREPEQFSPESLVVGLQCLAPLSYRERQAWFVRQQIKEINSDYSQFTRRIDNLCRQIPNL